MIVLDAVFFVIGILFLLILCYLFFLAAASFLPEKKQQYFGPRTRFAIIIPAHNEEELIGATLDALGTVDYPQELYEAVVIADNCTDKTVQTVQERGIACLERQDPDRRGKGFALGWAFPVILEMGSHDAYIVIDADTHMAPDFLQVINQYFCRGAKAVQGYSQARHPERSPMESLSFLGFALNRNLRYRGRSRLGWTANLMGTGMCFSRQVIEELGWNTTTMVEDIEYEMFLHLHGVRVVFAPDAKINVELHSGVNQTRGQRARWDMGKFEVRNRYLPRLLKAGFTKRDISYFDSALELLLPPFSLFCILVMTMAGFFFLFDFRGINFNFYLWFAIVFCLILYTTVGLVTARADWKVYRSLLYAPFFLFWRAWIIVYESCRGKRQRQW
jgi:cellulose synthase/poly-beta-1,6-N-acetylglucosamine synthase-like glycosyltransferase